MADVELLPCPFCGHTDQDRWPCEWLDSSGANVIRCAWCHGAAPAADVWNRRALASAPQQPAGVDEAMVAEIAKKLLKLRLTEVGGRKESPATTVKACLKSGLGGLYDDEAADYIVRAVLRYRDAALAAQQQGGAE